MSFDRRYQWIYFHGPSEKASRKKPCLGHFYLDIGTKTQVVKDRRVAIRAWVHTTISCTLQAKGGGGGDEAVGRGG